MSQSIFLVPLQLPAAVGEVFSQFIVLGPRSILLALRRRLSGQGKAFLQGTRHFSGESLRDRLIKPGNDIRDLLGILVWALLHWVRHALKNQLLLAQATNEEVISGNISAERMAEIRLGRFGSLGHLPLFVGIIFLIAVLFITSLMASSQEFALILVIAALSRLQVDLWEYDEFNRMGSILFNSYNRFFRLFSVICGIVVWYLMFRYAREYGISAALRQFVVITFAQVPIYLVLNLVCRMEVLLIPIALIGIALGFKAFL